MRQFSTFFVTLICAVTASAQVRVTLTPDPDGPEASPLLFSSYSEHHGGDLVPGIYEQYVVNPSLEEWYRGAKEEK